MCWQVGTRWTLEESFQILYKLGLCLLMQILLVLAWNTFNINLIIHNMRNSLSSDFVHGLSFLLMQSFVNLRDGFPWNIFNTQIGHSISTDFSILLSESSRKYKWDEEDVQCKWNLVYLKFYLLRQENMLIRKHKLINLLEKYKLE